jgi:SP family xylose:H+ symportor-like MFS transporter
MKPEQNTLPYVYRLTIVATLGGLLFGYDTAVVSGAVKAIREFFVVPLMVDISLAEKIITGYRITICVSVAIVWLAVTGMLIRLFGWGKGVAISAPIFALVVLILARQFGKPAVISADSANAITGFTVSAALIGCIVGASVAGFISMYIGRRNGLMAAAALFILSGIGAAFPEKAGLPGMQPLIAFIFYRILGGVGIGLASMLSPMYIAEIAPAPIRGRLVSWNQFAIVLGILVVYFVNWFIARHGNEEWNMTTGWRWIFLSGSLPSCVFIVLLFFIPETPRYLILRNKPAKALEVLRKTVGSGEAEQSFREISGTLDVKSAPWLSFGGLLIVISILLAAFQQFTGINVVLYYAPRIFQNTGTQLDISLLQTILVGAVNVVFTIIAIVTVDRFGRKPLLILGGIVMGLAMTAIGFAFYKGNMGYLALVFILIHTAGFAMSWGPVMWVVLSEIFPNSIRGAMSIATATVWITDLIISWSFPVLDGNIRLTGLFNHGFAYWLYALICFISVIVVWRLVPETKGETLEKIEKLWKN